MSHRSVFALPRCPGAFLLALLAILAVGLRAEAQTLGFDVGIANTYAGDPSGQASTSSAEQDGSILATNLITTRNETQLLSDPKGDLFLADASTGLMWVIAGSNNPIPALPGITIHAGHAYTVAGGASTVCADATDSFGDGCPAIQAVFGYLYTSSMAIDSHGNIFIGDSDPNTGIGFTRVIYAGGTGNTVAGLTGTPLAGHIYNLTPQTGIMAVDAQENLYFYSTDSNGNKVFSVLYSGTPQPGNPLGIPAGTPAGSFYTIPTGIGGSGSCTVGTPVGELCNGTPLPQANLQNPLSVIDPSGNIYFGLQAIYVAGSLPGISNPVAGSVYTIGGFVGDPAVAGGGDTPIPTVLGVPATSASTTGAAAASSLAFDAAGDVYFPGTGYRNFGNAGYFYKYVEKIDPAGLLTTVFGGLPNLASDGTLVFPICPSAVNASNDPFGDGCPATLAGLSEPVAVAIDPAGNFYVLDVQNYQNSNGTRTRDGLIRKSTIASSALVLNATAGIPLTDAGIVITNLGSLPLDFTSLTISGHFNQVPTGGTSDCSSATTLATGEACRMALALQPAPAGPLSGAVTIASNSTNATGGTNVVAISGTLSLASTATTLTASPAYPTTVNVGQPVTFTVTPIPQVGDTLVPTGTVELLNGATQVGAGTLNNGVATVTLSNLPSGNLQISAVYDGDNNFSGSSSVYVPVQVSPASTTVPVVTLTSSASTAVSGQSVAMTVAVATQAGTPVTSGTVILEDGLTPLGAAVPLDGAGTAVFKAILPTGQNTLLALFSGTSGFGANSSNSVSVTVTGGAQLAFTPGLVSTLAGVYPPLSNGAYDPANTGYSGDGGPAAQALISGAGGVAADAAGNLYIADTGNNVVRVIAGATGSIAGIGAVTKGDMYTFAGSAKVSSGSASVTCPNPNQGCKDGGQATAAGLYQPIAVATDGVGNVYIVDGGGLTIRRVDSQGIIQTVAGSLTGSPGFSGDGGLAIHAQFGAAGLAVDNAGNLYIADGAPLTPNPNGGGLPNDLVRRVDGVTGIITTVAGTAGLSGQIDPNTGNPLNSCFVSPCGDGGLATAAFLSSPNGVGLDTVGNLYIADAGDSVIRKVDAKTGIISTIAGIQFVSGGAYNAGPTGDGGPAVGAQFQNITSIAIDSGNNLYVGENGAYNAPNIRMVNAQTGIVNTLVGTLTSGVDAAGNNTCAPGPCGDGGPANEAQLSQVNFNLDSQGNLYWIDGLALLRSAAVTLTGYDFGTANLGVAATEPFSVANIGAQPLTFNGLTASTILPAGAPSPSDFAQQATGASDCSATTSLAPGSSCSLDVQWFPTLASSETGTVTVASNANNAVAGSNAITLTGTGEGFGGGTAQTITFPALKPSYAYGAAINLGATTDATDPGLSILYRASGPATLSGSTLTTIGVGTVTVTAYQFGNSQYKSAPPQSQTFTVTPALLTVSASDESITAGAAVTQPTYTVTGFVKPDTQASVITGEPTLTITDPVTGATIAVGSIPSAGTYNINISPGTLSAGPNYTLNVSATPATLSVTGLQPQTLAFTPLPNVTYGVGPITLNATSTNALNGSATGLEIKYVLSPASSSIATVAGNLLTVTGAGAIAVTATQSGSANFAAAMPVTVSFTAAPAPITVTAGNLTVAQGAPLPDVSRDFTFSGFVNGDTQAAITGAPMIMTAATDTSTIGSSAISIAPGSLSSANYAFSSFVSGVLTVVAGTAQTISFPPLANTIYGGAPLTLTASVNSPLGILYSVSGPAKLSGANAVVAIGAGKVTVTAAQPGAGIYQPASPVSQTFTVAPAVLTLTANNLTRQNDTQNPPLTYTLSGFVNNDTQADSTSGSPSLTTTATPASPVGTYPIVPVAEGFLTAANYTFTSVNGTLTVTAGGPTAGFSLTATPQQLNLLAGETGSAMISVTPVNYYQGIVTLSCGKLPANVVCTFSPATASLDATGAVQLLTLTVTTNSATPVVSKLETGSEAGVMRAACLYLPAFPTGLLIMLNRRRLKKHAGIWHVLLALTSIAGLAGLAACGSNKSDSSASMAAAPGTYSVTLTATGRDGSTTTLPVSIQIR